MNGKQKVGLDARAHFQKKMISLATDVAVGKLVALSPTAYNKGVLATNATEYPAVGFVYEGTPQSQQFGKAYVDMPAGDLLAGQGMNVYIEGILDLGVDTFTDAEVAKRIPIYEGVNGDWTKVKPVAVGTRARKIGFPINKGAIWCDFSLDPVGTVNP